MPNIQNPPDKKHLLPRDETEPHHRPAMYSNSPRPWSRSFPWLLNILLGITTIILSLQLFRRREQYQHTGDINNLAPHFTQRIQFFHASKEATAAIGHPEQKEIQEDYWRTFAPDGFGLIDLKDWSRARYPELATPTMEEDGGGKYHLVDTSMAHQLHCLHSILEAYNDLAAEINNDNTTGGMEREGMAGKKKKKKKKKKHHDHSWHLGHCFDYIRQGIMCCGDTALEGAATTFPDGVKGSDGWNAKHVCKDYEEVKEWIVEMAPGYHDMSGRRGGR